ncbi:MAG: bifunctional 5,10-methylene-tetrahydrofolate dehydrogenase/5,10-methylene-tetrahydrofolate cyclohydrolase [Chloroflexi bacterium]|nr:bifunctional 5,10-methylene-tetrahydrofolate dehydrogenase/5,10-methylene-tetrahydrofolate cyclohydrolase [Chloroflexota bacterium]
MTATILDGSAIAAQMWREVADRVTNLKTLGVTPGLAVILVGDNPASASYVRLKTRACAETGILGETVRLPADISQERLMAVVAELNADPRFHAILPQLPLTPGLDEDAVIRAILPEKDADGLHPTNLGLLLSGTPAAVPCTPAGVQQILLRSGYDPAGKHVVICGRSNLVGKPLAVLMAAKAKGGNATVTVCHTGTPDIGIYTRQADILVAAAGRANLITGDMVKPGAVVIDVGTNHIPDASKKSGRRMVGDVDFAAVSEVAAAITPVPGGVGPMTVAMLLVNTVRAAEKAAGLA